MTDCRFAKIKNVSSDVHQGGRHHGLVISWIIISDFQAKQFVNNQVDYTNKEDEAAMKRIQSNSAIRVTTAKGQYRYIA